MLIENWIKLSSLPHEKIVEESQIELKPEEIESLVDFFRALSTGVPWQEIAERFPDWIEPYYDVMTERDRKVARELIKNN